MNCKEKLLEVLENCSSGQELIGKGFGDDITVIAQLNVDTVAPQLIDGAFIEL